jgi:hypothetical protein
MLSKLLVASLPLACSALYLTYLHVNLSGKVQCQTTPYIQDEAVPIPDAVRNSPGNYVIYHEHARMAIPTASLTTTPNTEMLTLFLRHTMATFTRYPPAWGIWYLTKGAKDRATFNTGYIRSLQFVPGDRVCGAYVVTLRDRDRVTLTLNAPESYVGPLVEGVLVIEIKEEESQTVFVNHTVMWREKEKGSPGVLEGPVGRWMHRLLVRGLVEKAVQQLLLIDIGKRKLC